MEEGRLTSFHKIERIATGTALTGAVICLTLIVVLTSYQVTTRFLFGHPSAVSEVAARTCLIWMVLLGCAAAFRRGAMIAVDVAFDISPHGIRKVLAVFVAISILICLALLGWTGAELAQRFQRQKIAGLDVSIYWVYLAFPVGTVLCVPAVLSWLHDHLTKSDIDKTDVIEDTAI
jgi:TRAP-type C4-dicarboxylate transport system permease small subunit